MQLLDKLGRIRARWVAQRNDSAAALSSVFYGNGQNPKTLHSSSLRRSAVGVGSVNLITAANALSRRAACRRPYPPLSLRRSCCRIEGNELGQL